MVEDCENLNLLDLLFLLHCRKVHSSILTPENTELIQKSIYTLVYTLKNVEVTLLDNKSKSSEQVKDMFNMVFDCFIVEHKLRYSRIHRR